MENCEFWPLSVSGQGNPFLQVVGMIRIAIEQPWRSLFFSALPDTTLGLEAGNHLGRRLLTGRPVAFGPPSARNIHAECGGNHWDGAPAASERAALVVVQWMVAKSISHHVRSAGMVRFPLQMQRTVVSTWFNHGFLGAAGSRPSPVSVCSRAQCLNLSSCCLV